MHYRDLSFKLCSQLTRRPLELVGHSRYQLFCTAIIFVMSLLTACADVGRDRVQTVFPEEKASIDECGTEALKTRYFVHWQDGRVTVEEASDREDLIEKLVEPKIDEIAFVEPDRFIKLNRIEAKQLNQASSSDEELSFWGLKNTRAIAGWKNQLRGKGARVAVIDTGVDYTHPLLQNRIAVNHGEEGWDQNGRDKRSNQIDDDQNGYVDDWLGYHFYDPSDPDPIDLDFHGTHVAGIVAATHPENPCDHPLLRASVSECDRTPNSQRPPGDRVPPEPPSRPDRPDRPVQSIRPMGVAPEADIIIAGFLSRDGGSLSDAIKAIEYSVARGAHIINASWGGASQCSLALFKAIEALEKQDVLFIAAAGNSGRNIDERPEYPAAHRLKSQITVGSISITSLPARHSNFGFLNVDLFAPGEFIFSTLPTYTGRPAQGNLTGTSMATPFVSGALAVLKGAFPDASSQQLKAAILNSVTTESWYRNATRGRLNIEQALSTLNDEIRMP